jgi:general secretion pathway protein J
VYNKSKQFSRQRELLGMRGFTLLEIIIALAIFAVVMVLVSGGLSMVVRAEEQIHVRERRLAELQFAMLIIAHDMEQIVNRPVRTETGALENALVVNPSANKQLIFTRGGVINPGMLYQRSTLQRVAYGVTDKQLIRYNWAVLDRVESSQPTSRPILRDVTNFSVDRLNERGELMGQGGDENVLPVALVIHISLGTEGEIHRTFALPGVMSNVSL